MHVATNGHTEERRKTLPEAVGSELGRMAEEHAVVLGDQMHTAAGTQNTADLGEDLRSVGHGLQEVAADHEVELRVGKRQGQRVAVLKADARSEVPASLPRSRQMLLFEINAGEGCLCKPLG